MEGMVIGEYSALPVSIVYSARSPTMRYSAFAIGIGSRFGLAKQPDSKGIYIVEYLFVVLSPCAFIAADYVLLGRLARHLDAGRHLLIRPTRIMITFVASDITTFLM
jgi:hypothetical protein